MEAALCPSFLDSEDTSNVLKLCPITYNLTALQNVTNADAGVEISTIFSPVCRIVNLITNV